MTLSTVSRALNHQIYQICTKRFRNEFQTVCRYTGRSEKEKIQREAQFKLGDGEAAHLGDKTRLQTMCLTMIDKFSVACNTFNQSISPSREAMDGVDAW